MPVRRMKVAPHTTMTSAQSNENDQIRGSSARFSPDSSWFNSFLISRRRSSAVLQTWRGVIRQLPASSVWVTAFKTQTLLVRNAAGSIACAWIPNACYALGNIFSGKWYIEQSRGELIVANSMWASITYCGIVFISFLPIMLSFHFIRAPDHRPTVWFCLVRLGRATILYFLMATMTIFTSCSLIAYLTFIEPRSIKYKLDCYAVNFTLAGYLTGITRAVKRIHYDETIQGRDKFRQRQQKPRRSKILPATDINNAVATQYRAPSFCVAYFRNLPLASVPLLACVFVHVLSQQHIVDSENVTLSVFAFAGIALKLSVQEVAKYYVFKKRIRSIRIMCLLVGVPTVLIDTQMRIILLGTNSTNIAAMGALGMAIVEISLRAGKAALLLWQIRRRRELFVVGNQVTVVSQTPHSSRPSITTGSNDFEVWRRQMQAFHTAEANADMYAEYISIGCSASILFFYGNHPLYSLLRKLETERNDMTTWRTSQLKMLAMQIGVEVVVDYLSIVLEMTIGIEFDHVKKLSSFLAAMFMITAVMNINISVCVYLS